MVKYLRCLVLPLLLLLACSVRAQEPTTVAAAASIQYALEEIVAAYEKDTGRKVRLVFGASGNLSRQIAQGAPFHIFLSADEQFVYGLHKQGHAVDDGMVYAVGRVVLFVPKGSPIQADTELVDLARAIDDGRLKRLAIANPEHAPYGRAAQAVLEHKGLWERVRSRIVMGENISQAAQYAASGSAQAGLIALSLAAQQNFKQAGRYVVLPEAWHAPLRQRMALLKRGDENASKFYAYLQQPVAREIFKKHGFAQGDE